MPVRAGDIIAGKYQVERPLGEGAMGVVVAARHLELHELRAIKLMLPGVLADTEAVQRFLREARAAARLRSDHVAKIYDVGRLGTGFPYIVLELLEGTDLKALLQREGSLSVERAVRYVAQACDAVGEAHSLGIVHRDLKLGNLFLTKGPRGEERVKVLDFGIAKLVEPAGDVEMTRAETVLGTPMYMPPEQMRGARNADARSDVWALGVILYRLCTGRVPFPGNTASEIYSVLLTRNPESPRAIRPEIPPQLEVVILRCLEKEPAARFASANELGMALSAFLWSPAPAPARTSAGTIFMGLGAPRGPMPSAPMLEVSAVGRTDRTWVQPAAEPPTGAPAPAGPGGAPHRHPSGKVFLVAGAGIMMLIMAMGCVTWLYLGVTSMPPIAPPGPAAVAAPPAARASASTDPPRVQAAPTASALAASAEAPAAAPATASVTAAPSTSAPAAPPPRIVPPVRPTTRPESENPFDRSSIRADSTDVYNED